MRIFKFTHTSGTHMRSIAVTQNGSKNRRRMEMALAMIIFVMAGTMLQRMFAIEFFLIGGFVLELVIAIWNDIWDESEEVAWLEAELEVVERLVNRFSGYAGVWLEDGDGNEIDVDDLAHPNAPDGGMDCIIVVDADEYTEIGFERICVEVKNIIINGDY